MDLEVALQRIHEWSQEDGDLGFEYWSKVAKLLKRAQALQVRVQELEREVSELRSSAKGLREG